MKPIRKLSVFLILVALFTLPTLGQEDVGLKEKISTQDFATVKLISRSFPYDLVPEDDQKEHYKFELLSANKLVEIPFVERRVVKANDGSAEYHLDIYSVAVPEGTYRVSIPYSRGYRLANFVAKAGEVQTVFLPAFRYATGHECENGSRRWQMESSHPFKGRKDSIRMGRIHGLLTTIVELPEDLQELDLVVRHCESKKKSSQVLFKSAEAYFNNQYLAGDQIVYDREKQVLTAKGTPDRPAFLQGHGGKEKEGTSITISLRP